PVSGLRYDRECATTVAVPFIRGSAPAETESCPGALADILTTVGNLIVGPEEKPADKPELKQEPQKKNWFQRLFN
ncbi:MAG: hypothetical protein Q8L69_01685, partial [Gallionellaceae bacterium]|nr:hypothetical protein [Gallionellaceae bacterium]